MAYVPKANEEAVRVDTRGAVAALKAIGVPIEAIREANEAIGALVVRSARNIAPVKTGKLRNTIKMSKATTSVKVRAGMKSVPYAGPIHWGWFYDRNGFFYRNIKPNPFMSRALGYNRDEILQNYMDQMQKLLDKYEAPKSRRN